MVKKMKKWSEIHTRIQITTKSQSLLEGHPLPMSAKSQKPKRNNIFSDVLQVLVQCSTIAERIKVMQITRCSEKTPTFVFLRNS